MVCRPLMDPQPQLVVVNGPANLAFCVLQSTLLFCAFETTKLSDLNLSSRLLAALLIMRGHCKLPAISLCTSWMQLHFMHRTVLSSQTMQSLQPQILLLGH